MIGKKNKTNKTVIFLFVLILILIGIFVLFKEQVFQYIDSRISAGKTSSESISSKLSQEVEVEKEDFINNDVFERPKFQDLERSRISLPRFQTGKNDPFKPYR